nr:retrotransposon protein, putative, Ty1-copia subclass [Tanacetum cinerariifolium]
MALYSPNGVGGTFVIPRLQPIRGLYLRSPAAAKWQLPIGQPPVTWQLRQHRSTPPATGQRRRFTVVIGGQRRRPMTVNAAGHRSTVTVNDGDRRSTTVAGGEPPLTAAGPPLTTTGPPVNGGWWAGQRPVLGRSGSGLGRVWIGSGPGPGRVRHVAADVDVKHQWESNPKANKKLLKAKGKCKAKSKGKDKQVYIPKPKNPKPAAKEHPAKDDTCHHCKEGFKEARKLKQGALYLYVGNGVCAQVEAIGSFDLVLHNGLVICLDNCHYAPSITRGVVSIHRLVENRFVQCYTDFRISVSKNNVFYFNAIPSNGIYEINMHVLVPNNNSIYNVSTKKAKHNLGSTYLWHCHLDHISKKRIEKLQQEGLLRSTDDESFDQCVSCLFGKMTRKSFSYRPERATDLLGIIHTDVCGPLRHVSRQGASYFITFTDDYSHRGGEYISQEFKDYLKACEIVQQLTSPYTPQHNSVSERRNHTLLDMVRSVMNLTTLPLSFWGYALESATCILNMVPTKKVDKTPYELWYRKVPNLSYLKVEPPQEEVIPIRRSEKTLRAPNHLCLNVKVEEHSIGDLSEPLAKKL